nr:MAG TPA: Structural protein [Caudoviricetes sp.]
MFKKTKKKVLTTENSEKDIVSVYDQNYCTIQYMYNQRKHFHRFRRYTYNEPTCWFDDGYIYIEGSNLDDIESIYVTGNIDPEGYANGEEDVTIPGWMIPDIKKAIMTNELAFMLKRPSDDSNNSTLSSVKPNGP